MIPPIQSPNFLSEWTDAIVNLQLENIKILLNIDPELLWVQLPYTLDHENELYIELIQSLRLGSSVQPLSALQYCIIHYHQSENRLEEYNIISYLIEQATLKDLDTNSWGDCNNSTLHLACFMGQLDVLDLLLKKDVSISVKNNLGFSPYHVASNQAILDGLSFYEQKKKQQQSPSASQRFKMLRDLAEGSIYNNHNKPKTRPALIPHYFRTGYVKEAQKVLEKEMTQENQKVQIKEVAQLAKRSAVKNNLKQFESQQDHTLLPLPPQMISEGRRQLSFNPVVNDLDSARSKRDSVTISTLRKNNLVSSSTLRQQLNDRNIPSFTDELHITEFYSGRPSTIIEEPLLIEGKLVDTYDITNPRLGEEQKVLCDNILEVTNEEEPVRHLKQPPSTTESILEEYTLVNTPPSSKDDSLDIEMCRKVLWETKIIESEIDVLLAETEGSLYGGDNSISEGEESLEYNGLSYSDNGNDDDSIHMLHEEALKELQFIENHTQQIDLSQPLEQENSTANPLSDSITLSTPTSSFRISRGYENNDSKKLGAGSQRELWTKSLIAWSSNLDSELSEYNGKYNGKYEKTNIGHPIEEVVEDKYEDIEQKEDTQKENDNDEKKVYEKIEDESEEGESKEEAELRQFRNTLDIADEDLKLMLGRGSFRKSIEKRGTKRSFTPRPSSESRSLSEGDDLISIASSARSSSSIKTSDAIFYTPTPDPSTDKKPDDISNFYPPLPPIPAPVVEISPKDYHTCEEKQGKLHVHVHGIQDIKLPLPKEPTLVRCVVSDGRFEYISDYKKLEIDIEFDHKCTIDVFPGMSITVAIMVHPDYISTTSKVQPVFSLLKKHRNCFSSYVSKDDGAIGLAFCDISNCLPICREEYFRASISCFNTWYSKSFIERHTTRRKNALSEGSMNIAGKFDMDMFYSPFL